MRELAIAKEYRKDIDGLRAIAVISVIIFHLGFLPNGYLGVDIFFVISGYLITSIVYGEVLTKEFSVKNFYLRRIRRIIPLVLVTSFVALVIGLFVMLPDDLENLSQSVFATNVFANNILLLITTGNYWDVVNEFKPLMHTWSLGVEEQFYILYPIIFFFCNRGKGNRSKWIPPILGVLTAISLGLYLFHGAEAQKFYLLQYRFFELAIGGLGAILLRNKFANTKLALLPVLVLVVVIFFDFSLSPTLKLLMVTVAALFTLVLGNEKSAVYRYLTENKIMVMLGKISFSLYMWHQIVLAYARYFVYEEIHVKQAAILFLIILAVSILSYFFVEQPFRNKKLVKIKPLLITVCVAFVIVCGSSLYIYGKGGIIRDVPELDLNKSQDYGPKVHAQYNAKIYGLNEDFSTTNKIKVLILGNSFARDWANVLLESEYAFDLEISYAHTISDEIKPRMDVADLIFFSELPKEKFDSLQVVYGIDASKIWNVGTKNFGFNNGIFYNTHRNSSEYYSQRTRLLPETLPLNKMLKEQWGNRYIDLIAPVIDDNDKVPVFTPDHKFISQDCRHLTAAGAGYYAGLLDLHPIFDSVRRSQHSAADEI